MIIALMFTLVVAGSVHAEHWPADGSPRRLHGTGLDIFLVVALWPVQVPIALFVMSNAAKRGLAHRTLFALVLVPTVGLIAAVTYYMTTWRSDLAQEMTAHEPGTNLRAKHYRVGDGS